MPTSLKYNLELSRSWIKQNLVYRDTDYYYSSTVMRSMNMMAAGVPLV